MRKRKALFVPIGAVLAASILPPAIFAESDLDRRGGIAGTVSDAATGAPVRFASLEVVGTSWGAIADSSGRFRIRDLPVGAYEIDVSRIGYATVAVTDVVVKSGRATPLDISLDAVPFEGKRIRVGADYFSRSIDSRTSTTGLTYEELRRAPGAAEDVLRVIQTLGGIGATDQSSEIIVRGGAPWENLFLVDNIEVPNLNHFPDQGGAGGAITMLNTELVADVEFSAGGFGAHYGDKLSSVLAIRLREGNRERVAGELNLNMAGAGGIIEGPLADGRGSWMVSARRSYLELILDAVGLTAVPRYADVQTKWVWDLAPGHNLSVIGLGGVDAIFIEDEEDAYSRGATRVNYRGNQEVLGATWRALYGSDMIAATTFSVASNYWDVLADDGEVVEFDQDSRETEVTLKSEWTARLHPRWELSWGASLKRVALDLRIQSDPESLLTNDSIPFVHQLDVSADVDSWKQGYYVASKLDLSSRFSADAGIRFDHFTYSGRSNLAPRAGLSCQVAPSTRIHFAYGDYYQTPPYYFLTLDDANRRSRNYHARHYVIGLEQLLSRDFRGSLEVYYKDYDDYLVARDDTSDVLVSEGTGLVSGVEIFLQKKLTGKAWGLASYSLSEERVKTPLDGEFDGPYDYRHIASVMLGYRFSDTWEASVRWRYLGGLPYTPLAGRRPSEWTRGWEPVWEEPPNGARYPAYHRLDLRIDRRTNFSDANLVWYVDFQNTYGRRNVFDYRWNDDYTERDTVHQFGFLFVGGVAVEF